MRPIDKDKLITSIAWHDQQGMISTIDDVLDIIEAFPTLTPGGMLFDTAEDAISALSPPDEAVEMVMERLEALKDGSEIY